MNMAMRKFRPFEGVVLRESPGFYALLEKVISEYA